MKLIIATAICLLLIFCAIVREIRGAMHRAERRRWLEMELDEEEERKKFMENMAELQRQWDLKRKRKNKDD